MDVLRKRRTAKLVYNLLTISLAILLCSLAIILVDILLLNGRPLLESFYEFPEWLLFAIFQVGFFAGALVFGAGLLNDLNTDYNDNKVLIFLQQFDIVYYRILFPNHYHLLNERTRKLFLLSDLDTFCNSFTTNINTHLKFYETYIILSNDIKK